MATVDVALHDVPTAPRRAVRSAVPRVAELVCAAGGAVLSGLTALVACRPAAKPLHPRGAVRAAVLERHGSSRLSGVAWLDEPGRDRALVRVSRAVGLPPRLPDVHGLALRVEGTDGPADLLLASTGWGRLGRYLLKVHTELRDEPLTTLLPYRSPRGAVLLGARATLARGTEPPQGYALFWARPREGWNLFATLRLAAAPATDVADEDRSIAFDPVRHQLPGLGQYPWVVRLREPAYARARRSRPAGGTAP